MSSPAQTTTAGVAGIRRPMAFLSLTPVQSASYPKQAPVSPTSPPLSPVDSDLKPVPRSHRSSSVGSISDKKRFLKLGPVFWGGIPGEDDFAMEE